MTDAALPFAEHDAPGVLPGWAGVLITVLVGLGAIAIYLVIHLMDRRTDRANAVASEQLQRWTSKQQSSRAGGDPGGRHCSARTAHCLRDGLEVQVQFVTEYDSTSESDVHRCVYQVALPGSRLDMTVKVRVLGLGPRAASGDPEFDKRFKVVPLIEENRAKLTPQLRRMLINAHPRIPVSEDACRIRHGRMRMVLRDWPLESELENRVADLVAAAKSIT